MKAKDIFLCALSAVAIGQLLAHVNGGAGLQSCILMSVMCFSTFIIIMILHQEFRSGVDNGIATEEFMRSLAKVSYYQSSRIPLVESIKRSARASSDQRVSDILHHTAARVEFGDTFSNSVMDSIKNEKRLSQTILPYIKSCDSSIDEALELYHSRKKERSSIRSSLMTRYSTCNMFLSTVAPSFIIFSFIGSMLISQTSAGTELVSISLISGIPISYSVLSLMSSR